MKMRVFKLAIYLVVAFGVFAMTTNVDAANGKMSCAGIKVKDTFGLSLTKSGDHYVLSVNPKNTNDSALDNKLADVSFKVTKVHSYASKTVNGSAKKGNPLSIYVDEDPLGIDVEASLGTSICSDKSTKVYAFLMSGTPGSNEPYIDTEEVSIQPGELKVVDEGKEIKCNKSYPNGSFEYYFCLAKNKATTGDNSTKYTKSKDKKKDYTMVNFEDVFDGDGTKYKDKVSKNRNFTCNAKVSQTYKQAISSDENYYKDNTHYMFGSGTKTVDLGYYKYHFHNNKVTHAKNKNKRKAACEVKCEEALIVKYGPPVASKAGLCFTYKIKVESRVSCFMTKKPPEPEVYKEVCSPTPDCEGYNQGGPTEEFDQCIDSCDGGKYTEKCSNKCYKEIYGGNTESDNVSSDVEKEEYKGEYTFEKWGSLSLSQWQNVSIKGNKAKDSRYGGCYYQSGNTIYWKYSGNRTARWYYNHKWGIAGHNYSVIINGIPRTPVCHDTCVWRHTCGKYQYLNYGIAKNDKEYNVELYNRAIDKCSAKAKCTTTYAEYTISADYSKPTSESSYETVTIDFPRDEKGKSTKDQLSTCRDTHGKNTYNSLKGASTITGDVGKGYDGCYVSKCGEENYYMTEWSFPGAWIHKKTGEISFVSKDGDSKWRPKPDQFCVPRDSGDVNTSWWRWYYSTMEKVPLEYLCPADSGDVNSKKTYNIRGNTTRFGYFEWNMDFKCFYALDSKSSTEKETDEKECTLKTTDYSVRTVSNKELFPSASGTTTAKGTTQGRAAGYNWTVDAKLTEETANTNYVNDPVKVMEYIQRLGDKIYTDDNYVDYEFDLSREDLAKLKKYNNLINGFDVYCGVMFDHSVGIKDGGIASYSSNLFRSSGIDSNTWKQCSSAYNNFIKAKSTGTLGCNNDDSDSSCNTTY